MLDAFWVVMDNRILDASRSMPTAYAGDYKDIPKSVTDLVDDPFRSLAGELRRAGGFAKDTTPFSEFIWADFLRRRMKRKAVERRFRRVPSRRRCNWPRASTPIICPDGAVRCRRNDRSGLRGGGHAPKPALLCA